MFYGFVITEGGNRLLAKMVAGDTLQLSRVVMDKGTAGSAEVARQLTTPIDPGPDGTSTEPLVDGNTVNLIVEYRSDLNGGLAEGFWIGGFGIYAKDPDSGDDVMIYYGSLGDAKQYVSAYAEGTAPDVRRYPVSITVTSGVEAEVVYPAEAWMTAEDVAEYFNETLKPALAASLLSLIQAHDNDENAHPGMRQAVEDAESNIRADVAAVSTKADTIMETGYKVLAALNGMKPKRLTYRVKEEESAPSTRVEYIDDAVGLTPAHMDYTAGAFSYGSMADLWFVRDNKPVMVKSDGTVAYELDPNDYTKKWNGEASDVANTSFDGNAMSAMPLVWVRRWHENGFRYVSFCEVQYDDSYKAYAHTRPDGSISPFAYGAMFEGSNISNKVRSLSGQRPYSGANATTELSYAQANGSAWTITTWAFWNLIHDLLVFMGKSTNIQSVFGQGHTTGGSAATDLLDTGTLKDKGQFYGYSDTTHAVKVFHMENFWGDRWDRMVGLVYDNGEYKVKMTPEGNGYNLTGNGYTSYRKGIPATAAGGGWVKKAQQTEYGLFPTDLGGSETTYDCDYHYYNPAIVAVPIVGGNCANGAKCGRYLYCNFPASDARWDFGPSLFLQNPS